MKNNKRLAWGSTLLLWVPLAAPFTCAQEHSTAPGIVTRYCSGCHTVDGRSKLPYVPRLAGQDASYLENRLASFRSATPVPVDEAFDRLIHGGGARTESDLTSAATAHMVGTAHAISGEDLRAAAQWYAAQAPAHGRAGKGKLHEEGKNLFANGLQAQGLAACQTCHGPAAQGSGIAPRLAGQSATYVAAQLAQYRASERSTSPMVEVARHVGKDQVRALAAYLESL